MITVIIKRTDEPKVIQMTQADLVRQLGQVDGAEIMLEDTWTEGLKKVRTPYVSLVEPDAVFSAHYYSSNVGIITKAHERTGRAKDWARYGGGGGNQKLAMMSSCLGIKTFGDRIYSYKLKNMKIDAGTNIISDGKKIEVKRWHVQPNRIQVAGSIVPYQVQVGFVPGAIIRMSAIKDIIEDDLWLGKDLVKLSSAVSLYLWSTGRSIQMNPSTTYVSLDKNLVEPPLFDVNVPDVAANIFHQQLIGEIDA